MLHWDVKSENILLDASGHARIADAGFSKASNTQVQGLPYAKYSTCIGQVGTLGYTDPYYASNNKYHSWSDIYSLGVVVLELLTSMEPCLPEPLSCTLKEYVRMRPLGPEVIDATLKWPPLVPEALHGLAMQCLIGDEPERRPTALQVAEALLLAATFAAKKVESGTPAASSALSPSPSVESEEPMECLVCLEAPRGTTRIRPCLHVVACEGCLEMLDRCPLCRQRIQGVDRGSFCHTYRAQY